MKAANTPAESARPLQTAYRRRFGNRKDALALSEPTGPAGMKGQATTRQQLADLGLAVTQAEPDHWIVTVGNPLPEIHLYGAAELERFASCKARHYAKRAPKETDR
ncbi:hypothetical protein MSNKSG1_02459 [Marinobacter santoriniensis NKSG1]|uniref:Uncharacterized protein n=1 Tax=Marinobacter santoriniensis NKSG1 TaxID=1288826 RepID=M7CV90_9GAMM|nr:hypothetical protein [Marinobacter santoriniensis]EMP57049.1 hypothetical protein MSNKSG1_02459 [Marinobacter santoriniensis NKSG1]